MLERAPSQEVRRGSSARERRKPRARHVPIVQGSRRFVRARASEARVAGGCCSRVSGARSANGCSKGVWRAGMRGEDTVGCASPPFANSLADRRTANRRWISRVGENRQQSSDFRIGSLRAHVKPPLARTRLRNFGQNSLRSGASEPPPRLLVCPLDEDFRAPTIPARLCFTQRANPAHTNLQTRVRAFRVQLRAATRERETNNQKNDQENTIIQGELREKRPRCVACELGTAGKRRTHDAEVIERDQAGERGYQGARTADVHAHEQRVIVCGEVRKQHGGWNVADYLARTGAHQKGTLLHGLR